MMPPNKQPLVLLAAGGTGGHMFPAKALAEELLRRSFRVALATDLRGEKYFEGMEQVPRYVLASGAYASGLKGKVAGGISLLKGYGQSHRLLARLKPDVVVGFGGYPSAPPVFAAQHRGIPTVLHEQNAILGLANKFLAPFADRIALSASRTTGLKPEWFKKACVTGNPVRAEIAALAEKPYALPEENGEIRILIVGGSQGASVFSNIVPPALAALPPELRLRLRIIQQCRVEDIGRVADVYKEQNMIADLRTFFSDMPDQIEGAHLLITRSGASTVAEVTAAGRPAIFVPFPWNRDNQQTFNAEDVVRVGGGWILQEKTLTSAELTKLLAQILGDSAALSQAAQAAKNLGHPHAARVLADQVMEFLLPM
jgi:UDP-N-acetylglucosamine--N-acetylmuramyl-(pentapeptide) pyrophosphoryl-undecaprenol N-acetylglucosamine transferase